MLFKSFSSLLLGAVGALAAAGQLQQVSNFGSNPTGVQMWLYKPAQLANPLPLIVALHACQGSAQAWFGGTGFANAADQKGFIVIYPDAPDPGGCWDVHTDATLKHDAGGDSLGVASMVRYAIKTYGVDPNLVFVQGGSSGAMMTNVMLGAYPDLFKAGVAVSGVPYGCFKGSGLWNVDCANGRIVKTPQEWGDMVRSGYSGYSGSRPKFQFWHGTNDDILHTPNFWEEIKQWTNVFGVSQTPTANQTNSPLQRFSRASFGSNVQAILGQGYGHNVPDRTADYLEWFGLTNAKPGTWTPPGGSSPPTTTSAGGSTPTNPPTGGGGTGTAAHWAQCGGLGWTGPTACESPYTCVAQNAYYSQCV